MHFYSCILIWLTFNKYSIITVHSFPIVIVNSGTNIVSTINSVSFISSEKSSTDELNHLEVSSFEYALFFQSKNSNLSNLFLKLQFQSEQITILAFPRDVNDFKELFEHISALENYLVGYQLYNYRPIRFFIFSEENFLKSSSSFFFARVDSEIYIVEPLMWKRNLTITEIYTLKTQLVTNTKKLSNVIRVGDFFKKWERRKDLSRIIIHTGASSHPINHYVSKLKYNNITKEFVLLDGFGVNIFLCLRDYFNFKVKIVVEDQWPKLLPNGSWIGFAKLLVEEKVDIAIVGVTMSIQRMQRFSFLFNHFHSPQYIYFIQPPVNTIRNVFLQPLSPEFWLTIGISQLLAVFSFSIILKLRTIFINNENNSAAYKIEIQTTSEIRQDCSFWGLSSLCQQGWNPIPLTSLPVKVAYVSVLLGLGIIYGIYSAALYTSLSATVMPIKNFHDFLKSPLGLVVDNGSQTNLDLIQKASQFKWADVNVPQLLQHKKIEFKDPSTTSEDIFEKSKGLITFEETFYSTNTFNWHRPEGQICEDVSSIQLSTRWQAGMLMRKNFPYRKFFSIKIICLGEAGLLRRFKRNYNLALKPSCLKIYSNSSRVKALGNLDLFSAYIILITGIISSCVVLLSEFVYRKKFS